MPHTGFDPAVHGFAFANLWQIGADERAAIEKVLAGIGQGPGMLRRWPGLVFVLGKLNKQLEVWAKAGFNEHYGLCGGMAFAALDYYQRSDVPFPRGTDANTRPTDETEGGKQLRAYLTGRLIDSLTGNIHTFLWWMFRLHHLAVDSWPLRGGSAWLAKQTLNEWKKLKAHIDDGEPWPLGLIGETPNPTLNHQVLATGYEELDDGTGIVFVYDMNCPGEARRLKLRVEGQQVKITGEDCASRERGVVQGFFCEHYVRDLDPPLINWPPTAEPGSPD